MSPSKAPPRVFISYSHDSPEHVEHVLRFADRLRADGIDAILDQYEGVPPEGWPLWMDRQIKAADFVLVVCTETYLRRVENRETPGTGRGVKWESLLAYGEIYKQDSKSSKFIPVIMEQEQAAHIPGPLDSTTCYLITDKTQYEELYRRLMGQIWAEKPELGVPKSLPKREPHSWVFSQSVEPRPPGTTLSNVPHAPNPAFTGREKLLSDLHADLLKNGRQALFGLGGIGKTQVAVEYAHRHKDDYAAVLWTFADSEQSVISGFTEIAGLLQVPGRESKEQAVVTGAVRRWLDQNDGWLLVFDNSDAPQILGGFIPKQPRGHVLVTSRAQSFQSIGILKPREVSVLSASEAREFLLKRTSHEGAEPSPDIEALAKELGYFPLALEQAGAYILENQSNFGVYLESFRKQKVKLLEKQRPVLGDYKETVATTWAINFAQVGQESPASADLLRLSAFLAPDAIPLELFEKGRAELSGPLSSALAGIADDRLLLDGLLKPLTSYSLVQRSPETKSYSIHLLVQEVMRDELDEHELKFWAERTIRVVNAAFPEVEFENWPECKRLIPHSLACAKLIDLFQFENEAAGSLLSKAGHYLDERAQYAQAESLLKRSVAIYEKAMGGENPDTATSLNSLARLYRHQAKYKEAESLCLRVLNIREKVLGSEHWATASIFNDLAVLLYHQGKYEESEPLYRRALGIREKVLGVEHPDVAQSLNNLAALLEGQGKYEEAEPLQRRALGIRERVLGEEHPDVAQSLNNLAGLLRSQGKNEGAEPLYRRALEIREKALGAEHPDTATCLNNLAGLLRSQGKNEEAERLYRRALVITEEALGPEHPDTLLVLNNLIGYYQVRGNRRAAENLKQQFQFKIKSQKKQKKTKKKRKQ